MYIFKFMFVFPDFFCVSSFVFRKTSIAYQFDLFWPQRVNPIAVDQSLFINLSTVLSLKTATGAFEIEKVTLLFDPLKSAPSHSILMTFILFPFLLSIIDTGFPYSKQKHT